MTAYFNFALPASVDLKITLAGRLHYLTSGVVVELTTGGDQIVACGLQEDYLAWDNDEGPQTSSTPSLGTSAFVFEVNLTGGGNSAVVNGSTVDLGVLPDMPAGNYRLRLRAGASSNTTEVFVDYLDLVASIPDAPYFWTSFRGAHEVP